MPQNNVKVTLNPLRYILKFTSNIHINKHILGHILPLFLFKEMKETKGSLPAPN